MSSSQAAQLAVQYANNMIGNYCFCAGAVVFLYDSIITTIDEIQFFWRGKVTGAAILFWLNKYITTLTLVWDLATGLSISDKSCALSMKGDYAVGSLLNLIPAAFVAIRVYALGRSWFLCTMAIVLSVVPVGANFVNFWYQLTGKNIFLFGCEEIDHTPVALSTKLVIISRSCLIAADFLAIGATWSTLAQRPHSVHHMSVLKGTISSVFLLDGTVYFVTLSILNCLHLVFTVLSLDSNGLQSTSALTAFTIPYECIFPYRKLSTELGSCFPRLSAILISRFLLHLQSASLRDVGFIASSHATSTNPEGSIIFDRVVGSLGTPIEAHDYIRPEDDYGEDDDEVRNEEADPACTSRE
ncbi:hypothetical protein BD310DRAFT_905623 [Dichomitus squalens]|uniref:DUF6533 domain-containing protein n=1 Tax=Dichomitus squalens TaxID=114155 RepID=A0A4Q9PZ09_9APHY|nr:hypothetical protein BD310DRAFT_905623 [Dichomitus squalens]